MRTVVMALESTQSLDVLGPVEVLQAASRIAAQRGLAAGYEVEVVTPGGGGVALSNGLTLSAGELPVAARRVPHHLGGGRFGRAPRGRRRSRDRLAARRGAARAAGRLGLHRRLRARDGGPARRPPGDDALGLLPRARAHAIRGRRRRRADLRARRRHLDLGGRHRRDGPRAGARRGGPWQRDRAGGRALARALPQAPRRPVTVQRRAGDAAGQRDARAPARSAGVDGRPSRRRPVGGALAARAWLSGAALHARVARGDGPDAGRLRRGAARRARADALEDGAAVDVAARAAGFASAEVLRRVFHRRLGVGPAAYRDRFQTAAA